MLYNIYRTDGDAPFGITDWEHLRVMRLDYTERQLYNHRYLQGDAVQRTHMFRPRPINATLKKIAFISRDFSSIRPSGQLAINFFNLLSKYTQFSLYFYSLDIQIVDNLFDTFGTVKKGTDMKALSNMIVADDIDILIDMQGFMHTNFTDVLLDKPAPIQMHWLGYPGTLGIPTVDYLVADNILIPDNSQKYYCEKIAYLPHLYQPNNPDFIQRERFVERGYYNISEASFVFTHFNSDYKIDRALWFVWMDILKAVPNSILVFTILTSTEEEGFIKQLLGDAQLAGVEKQVVYLPKAPRHQHFNRLQLFNLGLDTYRVNGHTTSADLICGGVPFITCPSETYHNRVSQSILHELDLDDLVCSNFEMYKKKAIELATNKEYYAEVKQKVIDNREKTMFNTYKYTRSFVNMIFSIWDSYHETSKNRETIDHLFLNADRNEPEKRFVPFEKVKLSNFNNYYRGIPTEKWVFYENMTVSLPPAIISAKRKQYLRDFANRETDCTAFTTNGELFDQSIATLIPMKMPPNTYNEPYGIWVKEPIPEEEQERDVSLTLNKDYNLPKICMYYTIGINMDSTIIVKIIDYLFTQRYLNAEVVIVLESYIKLSDSILKLIKEHVNFVKLVKVNNIDTGIVDIVRKNTNAVAIVELKNDMLGNLHYIQKIYDDTIKNNVGIEAKCNT